MASQKDKQTFSISCDRNWKRMTRPRFCDVFQAVWEQLDDLGHDLDGAIIIALPKGASPRQVLRALREIENSQRQEKLDKQLDAMGETGKAIRRLTGERV